MAAACVKTGGAPRTVESATFRQAGVGLHVDPTVRPARLVPEEIDETQSSGVDPSGGVRGIVAGLRLVTLPRGAIATAEDRFSSQPHSGIELPAHLSGGFLFVVGSNIWRAETWLGRAAPIFTSAQPIQEIIPGLDRVYLRMTNAYVAIDGKTGRVLDLGPLPKSPTIASFAAIDAWSAAAVTDLRGVMATFDAGTTWRSLDLPMTARQIIALTGHHLAIVGVEAGHETWFDLAADGSLTRLRKAPREETPFVRVPATERDEVSMRIFGKIPLVAAIEDGWPLADGTAVIARDGALGRVRLSDGALIDFVQNAFSLEPARCHPIALAQSEEAAGFGFVCGEPHGATIIYAYDDKRGGLVPLRRFNEPRVVTPSGNGAIAVHGTCAPSAEPLPVDKTAAIAQPFCIFGVDRVWRDVVIHSDAGDGRVIVLRDGKIAVVSPPPSQDIPARLTVLDHGRATTTPIVLPKVPPDVATVLHFGVWLDGFEERRPGVVGGWIEAGGAMLGIEIDLTGNVTLGQYVRDAGMPFVSGRYGFGWTGTRGYETTDGGMKWTSLDLPAALFKKVTSRACGPIGCTAAGWLRVGWGEGKKAEPVNAPGTYCPATSAAPPEIDLVCTSLAPAAPKPRAPKPARPSRTPPPLASATVNASTAVLAQGFAGLTEMPAFYNEPGPALRDADRGLSFEVQELPERSSRVGSLARVYGWAPKTGEWDTLGQWQIKWLSPFSGWPEIRATAPAPTRAAIAEIFRMSGTYGMTSGWKMAPGNDAAHAMLIGRRADASETLLFELEADRAPVPVARADGEPFSEIEGVVRTAGSWFVATPSTTSPRAATIVSQIDGGIAREIARIPRLQIDGGRSSSTRLVSRSDGRAIGLVVDGQATADRATPTRWVLPIDLESGQLGEPTLLGYADLGGRVLSACTDDFTGWVIDTGLAQSAIRLNTVRGKGALRNVYARVRLTSADACIERLSGVFYDASVGRASALSRPDLPAQSTQKAGKVIVTAMVEQSRAPLACTMKQ